MKTSNPQKTLALLLLTLILFAPSIPANALDFAPPAELGLSPSKLQRITQSLQKEVEANRIAGAVALVARGGRVAYLEAVGQSDVEAGRAMQTNSLFRIASMTKAVTTTAILALADEGKLDVHDRVSTFLPEFSDLNVLQQSANSSAGGVEPASKPLTIHHLLTHTSGYVYGGAGDSPLDLYYRKHHTIDTLVDRAETIGDYVGRLSRVPLKFEPGSGWDYGQSTDILGRIVEAVSGLTLEQFFYQRIFRPLGMTDTHFNLPEEKHNRLSALYYPNEDDRVQRYPDQPFRIGGWNVESDYPVHEPSLFFSGGAGLTSSALDYARLLQCLLNGGELDGARILKNSTVRQMLSNQIGELTIPNWGHGDVFGYGFAVVSEEGGDRDIASSGSFSWGGLFNTYFWADPQEQLIGVLMTQLFPSNHLDVRNQFKKLVYEALDDSGFYRLYWYEKGDRFANPHFNGRQLRVNAPETSLHPTYSYRSEPRSAGLARVQIEEDLIQNTWASLYCEIWGGHPGTINKRVSVNGRSLYEMPEIGGLDGHCTHQYPEWILRKSDLVNGHNALQFACDRGETFWGHYIVDNACLKLGLPAENERLQKAGLTDFHPELKATQSTPDQIVIRLEMPERFQQDVASVYFQGRYYGYDENGDLHESGWHGMTKNREPYGWLGSDASAPFECAWDVSMLPVQQQVQARARVYFRSLPNVVYETAPLKGLEIPERQAARVSLHYAEDLPDHFWSRANQKKQCRIQLDIEPQSIESAVLHVVAWTGGPGNVENYFTLNGHPFAVADDHNHEVKYSQVNVPVEILKQGANKIELLSDTEHHGIEILLPGPALMIRQNK